MRYGMYQSMLSSDFGSSLGPQEDPPTHSTTSANMDIGPDSMDVEMENITQKLQAFPTPMPPGAYPKTMEGVASATTPTTPPGRVPREHTSTARKARDPKPAETKYSFGRSAPYSWNPTHGLRYEVTPARGVGGATGGVKVEPPSPTKAQRAHHQPPSAHDAKPSPSPPKPTQRPNHIPNPFNPNPDFRAMPNNRNDPFNIPQPEHIPSPNQRFGDRYAKNTSPFGTTPPTFDNFFNTTPLTNAQTRKQTRDAAFGRKTQAAGFEPRKASFRKAKFTQPRQPFNHFPNLNAKKQHGFTGPNVSKPQAAPEGSTPRKKHPLFGADDEGFRYKSPPRPKDRPFGGFGYDSPRSTTVPKPFIPASPFVRSEPPVVQAWGRYDRRWEVIKGETSAVRLSAIPWPIQNYVSTTFAPSINEITAKAIGDFILSPLHSAGMSRKKRIQNAIRNYHPDKFTKVLDRMVREDEKVVAGDAGDAVVRVLNEMLADDA
ncbi:hypothetical protein FRB93_003624 [Tulasnella sp. JGI-2019a]|nr:hypothetical protein FRB93_003624 [Tulasnella sp. JGI-2019a]